MARALFSRSAERTSGTTASRNAATNDSASGKRRSGSLSIARMTTASTARGTATIWLGRGGGDSRCIRSMSVMNSPRKGYWPVRRWNRTTPSA